VIVEEFGSRSDSVKEGAMFGKRPIECADLGGRTGLAFGFGVRGLEKDEGDGVGCEGEEDAEKGSAWARGVVIPEEGKRLRCGGFWGHLPSLRGAIFFEWCAPRDGHAEAVLKGGLGGSKNQIVWGGTITVDDD
jgi:hypothetical protein